MKSIFKIPLEIDSKKWSLNKIYAGVHWSVRAKDKEYIRQLVRSVTGIRKPFEKPVLIKMAFNSGLDVSNHGYLFKLIESAAEPEIKETISPPKPSLHFEKTNLSANFCFQFFGCPN